MHPVIKIVSFLLFGAAVSIGSNQFLLVGVLLVLPLYIIKRESHLDNAIRMIVRLKWLFFSILIVYVFFTPGQLIWPSMVWGPTFDGLLQGLMRIGALILLVAAVNYLLSSTAQDELISAIMWCLRPLSFFGLPHERLAIRITLTLDEVSQIRKHRLIEKREKSENNDDIGTAKQENKFLSISRVAERLFRTVIEKANTELTREITLPEESRPPLYQWIIPVLLIVLFGFINYSGLTGYF